MRYLNDTEVLHRLKIGDRAAFGLLYESYYRRIYGYCLRLLRDADRVEDIVQSTFLKALESVGSLEKPQFFSSWLFSIARNEVYAVLRKSRSNLTVELEDDVWETETPHEIYVNKETSVQLESALASLKPEYREVLILQHFEHLSYAEIATVMGDSVSSVESRLFKARKALIKRLGVYMQERSGS